MAAPAAPPPTGNRKTFRRTKVSAVERAASLITVVLLAVIGVAIWWKGRHFDPNRFALRTDALKSTVAEVKGKIRHGGRNRAPAREKPRLPLQTQAAGEGEAGSAEGAATASPAPAAKGEPLEIKLAGLKPMSDTEFYNADNLFEKIDGRAPAYVNFNVQDLRCRSFTVIGSCRQFRGRLRIPFRHPGQRLRHVFAGA